MIARQVGNIWRMCYARGIELHTEQFDGQDRKKRDLSSQSLGLERQH